MDPETKCLYGATLAPIDPIAESGVTLSTRLGRKFQGNGCVMRRHPILALSGISTLMLLAAVFALFQNNKGPVAVADTFDGAGLGLLQVAAVNPSSNRNVSIREPLIDLSSIDDFDLTSGDDPDAISCVPNEGR